MSLKEGMAFVVIALALPYASFAGPGERGGGDNKMTSSGGGDVIVIPISEWQNLDLGELPVISRTILANCEAPGGFVPDSDAALANQCFEDSVAKLFPKVPTKKIVLPAGTKIEDGTVLAEPQEITVIDASRKTKPAAIPLPRMARLLLAHELFPCGQIAHSSQEEWQERRRISAAVAQAFRGNDIESHDDKVADSPAIAGYNCYRVEFRAFSNYRSK